MTQECCRSEEHVGHLRSHSLTRVRLPGRLLLGTACNFEVPRSWRRQGSKKQLKFGPDYRMLYWRGYVALCFEWYHTRPCQNNSTAHLAAHTQEIHPLDSHFHRLQSC